MSDNPFGMTDEQVEVLRSHVGSGGNNDAEFVDLRKQLAEEKEQSARLKKGNDSLAGVHFKNNDLQVQLTAANKRVERAEEDYKRVLREKANMEHNGWQDADEADESEAKDE